MLRIIACLCLAGCPAPVGSEKPIPPDATQTCKTQCKSIGLDLDSVVIMASNVGCVCRASSGDKTTLRGASAGAGAMTIMLMTAAAAQQQQQQHR